MANLSTSRVGCPAASARIPGRLQSIFSPPRPAPAEVVRIRGRAPGRGGLTNAPTDSQSRALARSGGRNVRTQEAGPMCNCRRARARRAPVRLACLGRERSCLLRLRRGAASPGSRSARTRGGGRKNIRHPDRDGAGRRRHALRGNQTFGLRGRRQLDCGKANARRSLPGASAFCRVNPDAGVVPMAATGHDTIYDWRCVGRRAVAGKTVVVVDNDGYDAGNWKEVGR
jgi:hypothetical protein